MMYKNFLSIFNQKAKPKKQKRARASREVALGSVVSSVGSCGLCAFVGVATDFSGFHLWEHPIKIFDLTHAKDSLCLFAMMKHKSNKNHSRSFLQTNSKSSSLNVLCSTTTLPLSINQR